MDGAVRALAERTAVVLLAAGRATRFGAPKLQAELAGRPLVHHAAQTLADMPFAYRLCVATQGGVDLTALGFDMIAVEQGQPMSRSIAAGVEALAGRDVDAVLVALGDMPFITVDHLSGLFQAFDGQCAASSRSGTAMPPAIFGRALFPQLLALEGDAGARRLLTNAVLVEAPDASLIDIDTPADLAAADALGEGRNH